jgi:hypothetical protein
MATLSDEAFVVVVVVVVVVAWDDQIPDTDDARR